MGQIISCIFRFIKKCSCHQDQEETEDPNKHSSLPISTQELLESFNDTNSSFKLHQNVTSTCQNVTSTCIDIVEENNQGSASAHVLGVDNLEETENRGPERWLRYYCSYHKILLVGEGDFSFSACLAVAFGSARNMVATSLDSRGKKLHALLNSNFIYPSLLALSAPYVIVLSICLFLQEQKSTSKRIGKLISESKQRGKLMFEAGIVLQDNYILQDFCSEIIRRQCPISIN